MKRLLMVSNGEHRVVRSLKAMATLLTALTVATAFWVASAPLASAQDATYLNSLCNQVKKDKTQTRKVVRAAVVANPTWDKAILRGLFACLPPDCPWLREVLRGTIDGNPDNASALTQLAIELMPSCASSFGAAPVEDEGVFGLGPGNQNPPPGTLAGGGGQGNVVAICVNGQTRFVSPNTAEEILNSDSGATLGACQVTPITNR